MKILITDIPYFKSKEYTALPMDLNKSLDNLGLGISDKLFYIGFILAFGTEATVSKDELSEQIGISKETIRKVTTSLQEKGLLTVKLGIGRSIKNQYKIKYVYCDKIDNVVGL